MNRRKLLKGLLLAPILFIGMKFKSEVKADATNHLCLEEGKPNLAYKPELIHGEGKNRMCIIVAFTNSKGEIKRVGKLVSFDGDGSKTRKNVENVLDTWGKLVSMSFNNKQRLSHLIDHFLI